MSLLIGLPQDVWHGRICEFLELSELVRTHTAVANAIDRVAFEKYLDNYCSKEKHTLTIGKRQRKSVEWLRKHNVCLTALRLDRGHNLEWDSYFLNSITHVTELTFEADSIVDDEMFVDIMSHSPHIASLIIIDCDKLTNEGLQKGVAYCTNLTSFSINFCIGVDESALVAVLQSCTSIRHFKMSNFGLDLVVDGFKNHPNLISFECSDCFVSSESLETISMHLPNLQSLKLDDLDGAVGERGLDLLLRTCVKLRCLHLNKFVSIGSDISLRIGELPALEELRLRECPDGLVATLGKILCPLRVLDISLCSDPDLCDDTLQQLGLRCRSLTSLNVSHCTTLTDVAFDTLNLAVLTHFDVSSTELKGSFAARVLRNGSKLRTLNVSSCARLGKVFVDSISSENCLVTLNANYTTLSKVMWTKLAKCLPHVQHIEAVNCQGVTDAVVGEFVAHTPVRYFNVFASKVTRTIIDKYICVRASYPLTQEEEGE